MRLRGSQRQRLCGGYTMLGGSGDSAEALRVADATTEFLCVSARSEILRIVKSRRSEGDGEERGEVIVRLRSRGSKGDSQHSGPRSFSLACEEWSCLLLRITRRRGGARNAVQIPPSNHILFCRQHCPLPLLSPPSESSVLLYPHLLQLCPLRSRLGIVGSPLPLTT